MSANSVSSPLERLLPLLTNVRPTTNGWMARCPAHDDQHASLSIRAGDDGTVLVKCFAGCPTPHVLETVGLGRADLFPHAGRLGGPVACYPYRDEGGRLLYEVVRYAPKAFRQRRPDGHGGWLWKLTGVRRVLYRLPQLLAAPAGPIFLVEGEKDADALAALGLEATTNVGGAGKWRADYGDALRGRSVVLLPDNDAPGLAHARQVAAALGGVAASVRLLELPGLPDKGDVSDWLQAGGSADELRRLAAAAPESRQAFPPPAGVGGNGNTTAAEGAVVVQRLSDLAAAQVTWLWPGRLPAGKLVLIDGDPSQGKSLMSLDLAARLTRGGPLPDGHRLAEPAGVVLLSSEDGVEDTVLPRLVAAGADLTLVHFFRGVRQGGVERPPSFPDDCAALRQLLRQTGARLVVADPLMAFLAAGYCSISDQLVRLALAPLARVADEAGAVVLLIRHLNKGGQGQKAIYRGSGSIAIIAAARTAFLVGRDPEEADRRVLACTKNNLAAYPPALAYRIVTDASGQPVVQWDGDVDLVADDLVLAPARRAGEVLQQAVDFLQDELAKGAVASEALQRKARAKGIGLRTLERAKQQLGVTAAARGVSGRPAWYWQLPGTERPLGELLPELPPLDEPLPSRRRRAKAIPPTPGGGGNAAAGLPLGDSLAMGPGSERL